MCFEPMTMAIMSGAMTALSSMVGQALQVNASNQAAAANYNNQARYAESVNQAALTQQTETDSRNRIDRMRQAETAADKARMAILENRRAMSTARASAGTSGMMGMPLNLIDQNYQALIGGVGTNLSSFNQQLDENYFFNSVDSSMRANSITNQAIPQKPFMQKFGLMNVLAAGIQGAQAGFGAYHPSTNIASTNGPVFNPGATNTAPFNMGPHGVMWRDA